MAANELGVWLARVGRYEQAGRVLRQATAQGATHLEPCMRYLAKVEQKLGQNQNGSCCSPTGSATWSLKRRLLAEPLSQRHGIEWVDAGAFRQPGITPVAAASTTGPFRNSTRNVASGAYPQQVRQRNCPGSSTTKSVGRPSSLAAGMKMKPLNRRLPPKDGGPIATHLISNRRHPRSFANVRLLGNQPCVPYAPRLIMRRFYQHQLILSFLIVHSGRYLCAVTSRATKVVFAAPGCGLLETVERPFAMVKVRVIRVHGNHAILPPRTESGRWIACRLAGRVA